MYINPSHLITYFLQAFKFWHFWRELITLVARIFVLTKGMFLWGMRTICKGCECRKTTFRFRQFGECFAHVSLKQRSSSDHFSTYSWTVRVLLLIRLLFAMINLRMSQSIPQLFAGYTWTKTNAFMNVWQRFCAHDILTWPLADIKCIFEVLFAFYSRVLRVCGLAIARQCYIQHSHIRCENYIQTAQEWFSAPLSRHIWRKTSPNVGICHFFRHLHPSQMVCVPCENIPLKCVFMDSQRMRMSKKMAKSNIRILGRNFQTNWEVELKCYLC